MTRTGLIAALALVIAGCSGMRLEDFADGTPRFRLEEYFAGRTVAHGLFQDRFGRVRRQFRAEIAGRYEDGVLTLVEDFVYSDGARESGSGGSRRRARAATRAAPTTSSASPAAPREATSCTGSTTSTSRSATFWQVHFDDWMLLQDDGVMINRATVSKLGLTLGEVTVFFRKLEWAPPFSAAGAGAASR